MQVAYARGHWQRPVWQGRFAGMAPPGGDDDSLVIVWLLVERRLPSSSAAQQDKAEYGERVACNHLPMIADTAEGFTGYISAMQSLEVCLTTSCMCEQMKRSASADPMHALQIISQTKPSMMMCRGYRLGRLHIPAWLQNTQATLRDHTRQPYTGLRGCGKWYCQAKQRR